MNDLKKAFYFCGQVIPSDLLEKNFDKLNSYISAAGNTFYNALLDGLSENNDSVYTSVLLPKEISDSCKENYKGKWNIFFMTTPKNFLIRVFNNFTASIKGIFRFNRAEKQAEKYVVFNVLRLGAVIGGLIACSILGIKKIGVVTDVPGYRIKTEKKESMFRGFCDFLGQKLIKSFNCYILLSEAMAQVIPVNDKPYIIIEGLYRADGDKDISDLEKYEDYTVMYAGSLHYKYGIMNLVNAVRNTDDPSIRLLIFGGGEAKDEICRISQEDARICYKGIVSHGEILRQERKASLLVNPRPVDDEYVKYSFPSKNMEYMASGTPVLLTNIPSLPNEYKEYVFLAENGSCAEIQRMITEIKNFEDQNFTVKKAEFARNFILENKREYIQAARLVEFLDKCERFNGN